MTRPRTIDYLLTAALVAVGIWEIVDGNIIFGIGFVVMGLLVLASALSPRLESVMAWPRRRTDHR